MDKGDKLVAVNGFQGSIYTKPEKIQNATITGRFVFVFVENSGRK